MRAAASTPLPSSDRKSTRLNSSHANISYAVFCLKKNLLARHQEPAVAAAGHDGPVRGSEFRRHRSRNTVAHRPVRGGQLCTGVVVAPVTVDEDREVACVVGQ